jgi:hypothetical protein
VKLTILSIGLIVIASIAKAKCLGDNGEQTYYFLGKSKAPSITTCLKVMDEGRRIISWAQSETTDHGYYYYRGGIYQIYIRDYRGEFNCEYYGQVPTDKCNK